MSTRVAMVGAGAICLEHLGAIATVPSAEVVAVCDLRMSLASTLASAFGAGAAYDDLDRMLDREQPDVVHVLTPPQTHVAIATSAIARGASVFIEKPAATGLDDWLALRAAAERAGVSLVENHNYRFQPVVARALDMVRAGEVGRVVQADVIYDVPIAQEGGAYTDAIVPSYAHRMPHGAMHNFVTHPAYLCLAFMGEVTEVASVQRHFSPHALGRDELRALLVGPESFGTIAITSNVAPPAFALRVMGTAGTLHVDVWGRRLHLDRARSRLDRVTNGLRQATGMVASTLGQAGRVALGVQDPYAGLRRLLHAFYGAIREGGEPPVSLAEIHATTLLVDRLLAPEVQL